MCKDSIDGRYHKSHGDPLQVVWISGMPRSGTTWLSQIFASSPDVRLKFCPLYSYEFKNALDEHSSADDWHKLFAVVYNTTSEFLDQEYLRKKGLVPAFMEKKDQPGHLVIKSTRFHQLVPNILRLHPTIRFVHLVRHPCATIYSWLSNPYEFPQGADPRVEWRSGACRKNGIGEFWGFDDWKKVTAQALRLEDEYPGRFRIVRYERLAQSPTQSTQKIFSYCGIPYGKQTEAFVELSQSKHDVNKRSVFKNPALSKNWREKLDQSIIREITEDLRGTVLEQFVMTD